MLISISLLLTFVKLSLAQQVVPLNTLTGDNFENKIDVTPPISLYISAQMDSDFNLNNIFVKTMDNQIKSLKDLRHSSQDAESGPMIPFQATSQTLITTNLSNGTLAMMNGFIYVTTSKQSADPSFRVYSVDNLNTININGNVDGNCTIVFLNTDSRILPAHSSLFTKWQQPREATIKMYKGYPTDMAEKNSTQIFSNPVQTTGKLLYMPTVETFAVTLGIFYMKTTNDVYFQVDATNIDFNGYSTQNYQTTGFFMKSKDVFGHNLTINCLRDTRFNGTTGANIIGYMPTKDGKVTVQTNDNTFSDSFTVTPVDGILGGSVDKIGKNMTISSVHSDGGEFFVQYYIVQGEQISSTYAPGEPTTVTFESTTKGVENSKLIMIFCTFLISVLSFKL